MTRFALGNAQLIRDDGFVDGQTVVINRDRIEAILDDTEFQDTAVPWRDLDNALLLPGFIDLQVNGGGGVLFNDAPSVETIERIGAAHRRFGTCGYLPTLISDELGVVARAIDAVDAAIAAAVPGVLGIHIEGPFLNPERRGVHDAQKFRRLDAAALDLVSSLQRGKTLLTLAPELTDAATIRELVRRGVIVAIGHSEASYEQTIEALEAGASGFTHLFNAMSPLTSRKPGVVGAALDSRASWCGLISDGHHVHDAALRIATRCKPAGGCVLVTDAMPSVGAANKRFTLFGQSVAVENGRCQLPDGTLAGSDLDMASAVRNTAENPGIGTIEAIRMASQYAAGALGLGGELGRVEPGYRASLVVADKKLQVQMAVIDGELFSCT